MILVGWVAGVAVPSMAGAIKLALLVWLIGPLPLILTNAAFIKLHRVFVASYAAGRLIRFSIAGVAVGWLLHCLRSFCQVHSAGSRWVVDNPDITQNRITAE